MTSPRNTQISTQTIALRTALGPGLQFGGVTESLLREVSRRG